MKTNTAREMNMLTIGRRITFFVGSTMYYGYITGHVGNHSVMVGSRIVRISDIIPTKVG